MASPPPLPGKRLNTPSNSIPAISPHAPPVVEAKIFRTGPACIRSLAAGSRHREFPKGRLVQLDAKAGAVGNRDFAFDQGKTLGHEALIEVCGLDAILHIFGLLHGGEHMEGRGLDDAGAPGVEYAAPTVAPRVVGDAQAFRDAPCPGHIRLYDLDMALLH